MRFLFVLNEGLRRRRGLFFAAFGMQVDPRFLNDFAI
jgi:hypothetical protein